MTLIRALPILALLLAACGGDERSEEVAVMSMDAAAPAPAAGAASNSAGAQASGAQTAAPAMLIRMGTASVEVDSVERAMAQVQRMARQLGGYVGNSSISGGAEEMRSATLEVKVPSARFDEAVASLRPLGKVESVQVQAQDVGEEFVDVTARMVNARRLEERILGLLATRTGKLEDVLAVERELARVRQEIETHEGRLRFLRTRAAVSTLTVTLHEPAPVVGDYPGSSPIAEAFRNSWRNFIDFTAALIESLGVLIPLAVILAGLAWVVRRLFPRRPRAEPGPDTRPVHDRQPGEPPMGSGR